MSKQIAKERLLYEQVNEASRRICQSRGSKQIRFILDFSVTPNDIHVVADGVEYTLKKCEYATVDEMLKAIDNEEWEQR